MAKRNRERKYTRALVNEFTRQGARATRYPDDSMIHMPYDGHIFFEGTFFPFEAKFKDGGLTYNTAIWRKNQPHQFVNLLMDYNVGAKPFLIVFWKKNGRIHNCIQMIYPEIPDKLPQ